LKEQGEVGDIYVLTITRTRTKKWKTKQHTG
jgi:hypothetical protein